MITLLLGFFGGLIWLTTGSPVILHVKAIDIWGVSLGSFDLTVALAMAVGCAIMFVLIAIFWKVRWERGGSGGGW